MSIFRKTDYARESKGTNRSVGYKTKRGVKLPTQMRTSTYEKKFFIECPTGCTQHRNPKQRMLHKRTFDIRTNKCSNCGFSKAPADAKFHGAGFKKASEL